MRAPRLGDIEQFNSTETQTESNAVAGGGSNTAADDDWDSITAEFGLRQFMEAETQFDIDDILCSNYTQTRYYVTMCPLMVMAAKRLASCTRALGV